MRLGGVQAQILYQGSAGYPGVNQINIVIPDSVPTGCWISLAAVTGSVVSNIATLPINIGGGACLDPQTGLNGSQLQSGGGLTLKAGLVSLILPNTQNNAGVRRIEYSAAAAFVKYTGLSYDPPNSVSPGGCILTGPAPIPGVTGMDPGAISLTGPGGLSVNLRSLPAFRGNLVATLPAGAIPATGGSFTFTGTGGADVGSFTSTLNLSNPLLTWTNPSAAETIDRSRGLTVTWTGGNPGSLVAISGAGSVTGSGTVTVVGYSCRARVEAGIRHA